MDRVPRHVPPWEVQAGRRRTAPWDAKDKVNDLSQALGTKQASQLDVLKQIDPVLLAVEEALNPRREALANPGRAQTNDAVRWPVLVPGLKADEVAVAHVIEQGDVAALMALLRFRPELSNAPLPSGRMPLHEAIELINADGMESITVYSLVITLLQFGADPFTQVLPLRATLLDLLARKHDCNEDCLGLIGWLSSLTEDPSAADCYQWTPLVEALHQAYRALPGRRKATGQRLLELIDNFRHRDLLKSAKGACATKELSADAASKPARSDQVLQDVTVQPSVACPPWESHSLGKQRVFWASACKRGVAADSEEEVQSASQIFATCLKASTPRLCWPRTAGARRRISKAAAEVSPCVKTGASRSRPSNSQWVPWSDLPPEPDSATVVAQLQENLSQLMEQNAMLSAELSKLKTGTEPAVSDGGNTTTSTCIKTTAAADPGVTSDKSQPRELGKNRRKKKVTWNDDALVRTYDISDIGDGSSDQEHDEAVGMEEEFDEDESCDEAGTEDVTASPAKPTRQTSRFDGQWSSLEVSAIIIHEMVTFDSGEAHRFESRDESCTLYLEELEYQGHLDSDGMQIRWNDGDVWTRVVQDDELPSNKKSGRGAEPSSTAHNIVVAAGLVPGTETLEAPKVEDSAKQKYGSSSSSDTLRRWADHTDILEPSCEGNDDGHEPIEKEEEQNVCDEQCSKDMSRADVLYSSANAWFEKGDLEAALADANALAELEPESCKAYDLRARCLLFLDRLPEAHELCKSAPLKPSKALECSQWRQFAGLAQRIKHHAGALDSMQALWQGHMQALQKDCKRGHSQREARQKEVDKCLRNVDYMQDRLSLAEQQMPFGNRLRFEKVKLLLQPRADIDSQQSALAAIEEVETLLRVRPRDPDLHCWRARALLRSGRRHDARCSLEEAMRCSEDDNRVSEMLLCAMDAAEDHKRRAMHALEQEDYKKAELLYGLAIKVEPPGLDNSFFSWLHLSRATARQKGSLSGTLEDINAAIEFSPRSAKALFRRGCLYIDLELFDEACTDFEQVEQIDNTLAGLQEWQHKARALARQRSASGSEPVERVPDLYQILEIGADATGEDIKKAYKAAARKWHPDKNPGPKREKAERRFKEIASAFEVLDDPVRRCRYDIEHKTLSSSDGSGGPKGATARHRKTKSSATTRGRYNDD